MRQRKIIQLLGLAKILTEAFKRREEGVHAYLLVKLHICKSTRTAHYYLKRLQNLRFMASQKDKGVKGKGEKRPYTLTPYGKSHVPQIRVVRSERSLLVDGVKTVTIDDLGHIPYKIEIRSGSRLWVTAPEETVLYLGGHPGSLDIRANSFNLRG
jgi:hypothetical protein